MEREDSRRGWGETYILPTESKANNNKYKLNHINKIEQRITVENIR